MKALRPPVVSVAVCVAMISLTSCVAPSHKRAPYSVKAFRPKNPAAVEVKVSLSKQIVYVTEGDRLLMAAATCVGLPGKSTPQGHFHISSKIAEKRSNSYGYFVNGADISPGEAAKPLPGRFVGYPMAYWCEFSPAYGFHAGYVHPVPRTHGCLRLHKTVAPKFFALVREGTPVHIAQSLPEDLKYSAQVAHPKDYQDPDPPAEFMISAKVFEKPDSAHLLEP
jgi:hypothetical protein